MPDYMPSSKKNKNFVIKVKWFRIFNDKEEKISYWLMIPIEQYYRAVTWSLWFWVKVFWRVKHLTKNQDTVKCQFTGSLGRLNGSWEGKPNLTFKKETSIIRQVSVIFRRYPRAFSTFSALWPLELLMIFWRAEIGINFLFKTFHQNQFCATKYGTTWTRFTPVQ